MPTPKPDVFCIIYPDSSWSCNKTPQPDSVIEILPNDEYIKLYMGGHCILMNLKCDPEGYIWMRSIE